MFVFPEIIFSFIMLSIVNFSNENMRPLYSLIIKEQFFIDHPIFLILFMAIEWIGILGLFLLSIKLNRKLLSILLGIILLWMSFVFYIGYIVNFLMSIP